jgi:hypothetical protein
MAKKLISIGYNIPGYSPNCHPFSSDQSILDADLVVFEPKISGSYFTSQSFQGLPWFDDSDSFRLKDASRRWRDETQTALNNGKTIFVI